MSPLPVVICSKSIEVGRSVNEALKPEYEVTHFIRTTSIGTSALPAILQGQAAPKIAGEEIDFGNHKSNELPIAIIVGHNFNDAEMEQMMAECCGKGKKGCKSVPWLRPDKSRARPPFGEKEFIEDVVTRVKACMKKLGLEKGGETKDGGKVVYY